MDGGKSSRRNTETSQAVGSGGAARRLAARVSRRPFWDFEYHELKTETLVFQNPEIAI
jgi:hypothetical protein